MTNTTDDRPASKVARLIDEYNLEGLGSELEMRWTGNGFERMSLRDLATFFNKQLVENVLIDTGMSALNEDVKRIYQNLVSEDVSTGVRTETKNRLKINGVDIDKLEQDFVTYQAIRTYLKEWRGAKYETLSDQAKIDKDLESIQRLLTRTLSVTEERIENLQKTERIDIEEFEVLLDAQVLCQRCGSQQPIADLLEQGGCDCLQT